MTIEKKTSRRKKAEEVVVVTEVALPVKKKVPAKKAAAKKAATAVPVVEAVEPAQAKPARKAAPRKTARKKVEAPPASPAPVVLTSLLLQRGQESRVQWQAGEGCPAELAEFAAAAMDAEGGLPADAAHDFVVALIEKARSLQHALTVEAAIWPQLALKRDAQARVRRIEQLWTRGFDVLPEGLRNTCPEYQLEAALFAVSAGRALLADDVGLGQREAALAALHLWRGGFGLARLAVLAPASRHAVWRAALPEGVRLAADPSALVDQVLDVLVVDGIEAWEISSLSALQSTHLHLLANSEPLKDERLAAWVEWLDDARRGALARFAALPAEAGTDTRREALQTLLLSRRKREFAESLPARLEVTRELAVSPELPAGTLDQLKAACARWQGLGFATEAERAQVLAALRTLRAAEIDAALLASQAESLRQLADEWAPLKLHVAAQPAKLAALWPLLADRPQLLLTAATEATALVHLDMPWSADALQARHAGLPQTRGLPVAWLLPAAGLSAALRRAPLTRCLDASAPWWSDADWAALMESLPTLLDW